jgi:hypothetical protein
VVEFQHTSPNTVIAHNLTTVDSHAAILVHTSARTRQSSQIYIFLTASNALGLAYRKHPIRTLTHWHTASRAGLTPNRGCAGEGENPATKAGSRIDRPCPSFAAAIEAYPIN